MLHSTRWVFFDLDGTLADNLSAMYTVYENFLEEFGCIATKEEFDSLNGPSLREIVAILKHKYTLLPTETELYDLYERKLAEAYHRFIPPMPQAGDLLERLQKRNIQMMVVTSAPERLLEAFIHRVGWQSYFQEYVSGNEVQSSKPQPEIYHTALHKARVAAEYVYAVEDSPNGVKSAVTAGIPTLGFAHHYSSDLLLSSGARYTISQLHEVMDYVE